MAASSISSSCSTGKRTARSSRTPVGGETDQRGTPLPDTHKIQARNPDPCETQNPNPQTPTKHDHPAERRRLRRQHPSPPPPLPPPLSPPPSPRTHPALKAPRLRLSRPFTCVPRHKMCRAPARAPASSAPFLIAAPGWSKVCRFGDFGQAPERHHSLPSAPQAARELLSGQEGGSVDSIMGSCKLGQFLMLRR